MHYFWGKEQEGAENINHKFRFCPKIVKHLHQLEMFNGSNVLHII